MFASLGPIPQHDVTPAPGVGTDNAESPLDEEAPGALLEAGLRSFFKDEHHAAAAAFRSAIATDELNDAGRALAYWHISLSERRLGETDRAADALSSFVTVASDLLLVRASLPPSREEGGDFAERFDITGKLDRARALLSASWATRASDFGRSRERPVPVRTDAEIGFFLALAAPCPDDRRRSVASRQLQGTDMRLVTRSCGGEGEVDYFFALE